MALLCPSLETAKAVLAEQGVQINSKTLRRYCRLVGEKGMEWRGRMSLSGTENLAGVTVVVGIDGGRLRERQGKRGRWKKGQKRRGYTTEWREPKLFTIYFLNREGEVIREIPPLHDAMKKLRITVNNMVYEVTVQVLEDDEQVVSGAGYLSPPLAAAPATGRPSRHLRWRRLLGTGPPAAAMPTPSPRPSPARSRRCTSRREARRGEVTGLPARRHEDGHLHLRPHGGTVAEVVVAVGDAVQVGQVLLHYRPED